LGSYQCFFADWDAAAKQRECLSTGSSSKDVAPTFRPIRVVPPLQGHFSCKSCRELSGCKTTQGAVRSLGLAGVAVKSGARSAVGTLWRVNDEPTSLLEESFYLALREPGVSRAEALRRVQRVLLDDQRFQHAAYWSSFLMINDWL